MVAAIFKGDLIKNNIFLVIPSWGKLLGYPTLGNYANHNVIRISEDIVIFFGGMERLVHTPKGLIYYILGLGYYYTKFEIQSGRYITDSRILTGLMLSDFVYDRLATSRDLTLQNDPDVVIAEDVVKVPIDLSRKPSSKQTFIQGTLMRNLFIPYKDVILDFMEKIKDPKTFQIQKTNHMLLCSHWDYFNTILISDAMKTKLKVKYLEPTAGLNKISLRLYRFLIEHFSDEDIQQINENINILKNVYSTIQFDPMHLYSLIEQANIWLKIKIPNVPYYQAPDSDIKYKKNAILQSGNKYLDVIVNWPEQFKQQTKKELEDGAKVIQDKLYHPKSIEKQGIKVEPKREHFEPRFLERPTVKIKQLPPIPMNNIIDILSTLKTIVEEDYDIRSIGEAFAIGRDYIKSMVLHQNFLWDMSKLANIYQRGPLNKGMSSKEKYELLEKIDNWIDLNK
ncbi:MAG: hypothetical protein EU531_02025 [Promethearchaeota archaeon]|nr:MAG: hypothetical protein EU531_02025 [Candidatus Lokiarchaeota archaeon]